MKIRWRIILKKLREVKGLLKLIFCEIAKLRRKPLFLSLPLLSILIPLSCALFLPEFQHFADGAEAVDTFMASLFQLSAYMLLMPAAAVLAANLFFEEQDNDTLKNLLTIPVRKTALALAKMLMLLFFAVAFMALGGLAVLLILLLRGLEPTGFLRLFFIGLGEGILMWSGVLPCVLLVIALNKSYIISVIITFFYTIINYLLAFQDAFLTQPFGFNPGTLLPGPLSFRWYFQFLGSQNPDAEMAGLLEKLGPYFTGTVQTFLIAGLEALVFLSLTALVYQRQNR